jgi:hypothetical protein
VVQVGHQSSAWVLSLSKGRRQSLFELLLSFAVAKEYPICHNLTACTPGKTRLQDTDVFYLYES